MSYRSLAALAIIALAVGCGRAADPTPVTPAQRGTTTASLPAPEKRTETPLVTEKSPQEISIESVEAGNPLLVRGRARTFENNVAIRVRDAEGTLLTETHTTSVGEAGQHNPFESRIWIVREPGAKVTVEAFEYSAKDGAIQSLTTKTASYDVESIDVTLLFSGPDCTAARPVVRRIPKSVAMARLLVEALIAGPTPSERSTGASSPFPAGSAVRSVILRNGELTVDFNERLQNVGGSCAVVAIRDSVTRTLGRLPRVKDVIITANGRRDLALQP
jgi:hypothetical protein